MPFDLLTPSETRARLAGLDHRANKTLGQNFLIDGNIVRKSIELAEIPAHSTVIEIGPGLGTLTRALLNTGSRVCAVEKDPTLARYLRENLIPLTDGQLTVQEGDALDYPIAGWTPVDEDFSIVANLPYAITTPWIESVIQGPLPRRMVLMMQKEAGDRLRARPPSKNFSAISIFLAATYRVTAEFKVSRNCFYPVPGVDSLLLRLDRIPEPKRFSSAMRDAIRQTFTQRRKQIGAATKEIPLLHPWVAELAKPTWRAEEIPLENWLKLA